MKLERSEHGLSVRIPDDVAAALGLKEGDEFDLCSIADDQVAVVTDRQRRLAALARLKTLAISFPVDYRFDREEANAR